MNSYGTIEEVAGVVFRDALSADSVRSIPMSLVPILMRKLIKYNTEAFGSLCEEPRRYTQHFIVYG